MSVAPVQTNTSVSVVTFAFDKGIFLEVKVSPLL